MFVDFFTAKNKQENRLIWATFVVILNLPHENFSTKFTYAPYFCCFKLLQKRSKVG